MHILQFLFVLTCSVTLLCPGSASAASKRKSSSTSSAKVSPPSYPEEEEPLIDQIAMESNDNAQPQSHASVVAPPPSPVGYTGFKINPNCKCGKSPYTTENGNPHPWTAAIFYKNDGKDSTSTPSSPAIQYYNVSPTSPVSSMLLFCTGSLINDRYILTASRCVQGLNATDLEVWLSDKSIWTDHELPSRSLHNETLNKNLLKKIPVDKIIIHPDFNPSILDNEIALLRLADPVRLSRSRRDEFEGARRKFYATPVCLPKNDLMSGLMTNDGIRNDDKKSSDVNDGAGYIPNLHGTVVSWDKKGRTSYSLVDTEVPIVNGIKKCLEMTPNSTVLTENMLCAGKMEQGAPESCAMDTGSPLVIYEDGTLQNSLRSNHPQERIRIRSGKEDNRGHYTLIGVSSWLYGCSNLTQVNILYDVIFDHSISKPQTAGVYAKVESWHEVLQRNVAGLVTDAKYKFE